MNRDPSPKTAPRLESLRAMRQTPMIPAWVTHKYGRKLLYNVDASPIVPAVRVNHWKRGGDYVFTPDNNQKTGRPSHFWGSKKRFDM